MFFVIDDVAEASIALIREMKSNGVVFATDDIAETKIALIREMKSNGVVFAIDDVTQVRPDPGKAINAKP